MDEAARDHRRTHLVGRWGAALAVLIGLIAGGVGIAPAGAQVAPTLTITPSTGLVDGQSVDVAGSGFLSETTTYLLLCPPGATDALECDLSTLSSTTSSPTGTFTTTFVVRRFISGIVDGVRTDVDCTAVDCLVGAGDIDRTRVALGTVAFAEAPPLDPEVDVEPAGANGLVTLTGTGFLPRRRYDLHQCPPGSTGLDSCEVLPQYVVTQDDGSVTGELYPRGDLLIVEAGAPVLLDCVVATCTLHLVDTFGTDAVSAPLDLSGLPPETSTLTAAPVTALEDSTAVEVIGTGYATDGGGPQVRQCAVVGNVAACPQYTQFGGSPDGTGQVAFTAVVRRDALVTVGPDPTFADCVASACFLLSEELMPDTIVRRRVVLPLSFAPAAHPPVDPIVTVSPTGGDAHDVVGTGFPLGGEFPMSVCGVDPDDGCTFLALAIPDSSGGFTIEATIPRFPDGVTGPDCLLGCVVRSSLVGAEYATSDPFTTSQPVVDIAIDGAGTLDPGTDDAVVSATITCDQPTQVEVTGTVSQPGVSGGYAFTDRCSPDDPLLAFIPTRTFSLHDDELVLGPADVSITARSSDGPGGTPVTETGTVTLYDEDAIVAVVGAALQDPANVELRTRFLRSVAARVRQDPVFAAELFRILFGGG